MSNGGDRLPADDRELAAVVLRARIRRVLLRERCEVAAGLDHVVDLVGLRLRLDEDVAHVPALGLGVLALVLLVVLRDVGVRDLGILRDRVVDLLRQQLRLDVGPEALLRVALLLQLLVELRLAAAEGLLLDLVDPGVDLLVRHRQLELRGPVVVLGALNEERDSLRLQRLVLGRACLRECPLLRLVGRLRPGEEPLQIRLRHRHSVDDGNCVAGDGLITAAAGGRDEHDEGNERSNSNAGGLHERRLSCRRGGNETVNV